MSVCPGCFVLDEMPHESTCPDLRDGEENVQVWHSPEIGQAVTSVTVTSAQYGALRPDGKWEIQEVIHAS